MSRALEVSEFMALSQGHLTVDVRSPKEFAKGHIPHAINLPLFDDEERAKVGTIYKQTGRNEAIEAGLEIVGPKMAGFVRFVKDRAIENKIFVHCWRGGMRSGSMAWLFDTMGHDVYTLKSGYKAYRHMVIEQLGRPARYVILSGRTGSGKTEILHHLRRLGEQTIDLEGLAHHKGSAFGALGEPPQPSTEHFENMLHHEMSKLDPTRPIWLEDESKNIGKCSITDGLWTNMLEARTLVIDLPLGVRVQRLIRDYGAMPAAGLEDAIRRIERRLGHEAMTQALQCLEAGDLAGVARISLVYYDKAYNHGLASKKNRDITHLSFETDDMAHIAKTLRTIPLI